MDTPATDPRGLPAQAELKTFAVAVYGAVDVATICLEMQDRHGADVNLLLWCCWLGRHGARVDRDTLARADQAVRPWRETAVHPLRAMRRRLKNDIGGIGPEATAALRETIKAAEIDAEFLELDHLRKLAAHVGATDGRDADRMGVCRGNLLRYLELLGVTSSDAPRNAIETLARASIDAI